MSKNIYSSSLSFKRISKTFTLFFKRTIRTYFEIIFSLLYPLVWLMINYFSYSSLNNFFDLSFGTWIIGSSTVIGILSFGRTLGQDYFNGRFLIQKIYGYKKIEYFVALIIYYFLYSSVIYFLQIFLVYIIFGTSASIAYIFLNWLNNFSVVILCCMFSLVSASVFKYYRSHIFFLNITYTLFLLLSGYSIPYFLFNGSLDFEAKGWYNFFQAIIPIGNNIQLSAYMRDAYIGNFLLPTNDGWYIPFATLIFYLVMSVTVFLLINHDKK